MCWQINVEVMIHCKIQMSQTIFFSHYLANDYYIIMTNFKQLYTWSTEILLQRAKG